MTETADEREPRRYNPQLLTPRDMRRAREHIPAEILDGRSAYDLLEDDDDRVTLTIWCLETRTDPSFTWEQALDTPYLGEWKGGEPGPPRIAAPPAGGARNDANESSATPNGRVRGRSSASTSG